MDSRIGFFIHPIPLSAVALMAVNDHWFKRHYPGWLTGKISDFCGIFYFPMFLLALAVCLTFIPRFPWQSRQILTRSNLLIALVATDCLLILVKLHPPAARAIESFFLDYFFPIYIMQDPTDLWALTMNPLTYFYLKPYLTPIKESPISRN